MKGLKDRLENLFVGEVQSVDGMSVIPLIDEDEKEYPDISPIEEVEFSRTTEYGTMHYENSSDDGVGVVPSNHSVISEELAQDHAMGSAGLVESGQEERFDNACCIESSQGGYLSSNSEKHLFGILPIYLRNVLNNGMRQINKYSRLWDSIAKFNKDVDTVSVQALNIFFEEYEEELDNFVAEFEVVRNQVGAMIFFGKELVGLEIAPRGNFWKKVWDWLVRGCYGSEYIRQKKMGNNIDVITPPELDDVVDIDGIEESMNNYLNDVREELVRSINPKMQIKNDTYQKASGVGLDYVECRLNDSDYIYRGDVVENNNDEAVYVSLVRN